MTQQSLPLFGWDIVPVMGAEVIIEKAFMDVSFDLIYGGGWMEIEREEVDQECNWALVSAIIVKIHDHRLTCFVVADRVRVAPLGSKLLCSIDVPTLSGTYRGV
jgi:hypothetical protein